MARVNGPPQSKADATLDAKLDYSSREAKVVAARTSVAQQSFPTVQRLAAPKTDEEATVMEVLVRACRRQLKHPSRTIANRRQS